MRVAKRLLPLLLVVSALGCASDQTHQWAESRFAGLTYEALFGVVTSTIDGEGFAVRRHDPSTGTIETDWAYGTSLREVRGPSRRKVHARVEIDEASGGFRVRLRVAEEVLRQRGELATHVRESTDWEGYADNWDDATYLMAKLTALLRDYRVVAEIMPEPRRAGQRDLRP